VSCQVFTSEEGYEKTKLSLLSEEPFSFRGKSALGLMMCVLNVSTDHGILAHSSPQHGTDRGDEPLRKKVLLKGETKRRRLGIPMFPGKVT